MYIYMYINIYFLYLKKSCILFTKPYVASDPEKELTMRHQFIILLLVAIGARALALDEHRPLAPQEEADAPFRTVPLDVAAADTAAARRVLAEEEDAPRWRVRPFSLSGATVVLGPEEAEAGAEGPEEEEESALDRALVRTNMQETEVVGEAEMESVRTFSSQLAGDQQELALQLIADEIKAGLEALLRVSGKTPGKEFAVELELSMPEGFLRLEALEQVLADAVVGMSLDPERDQTQGHEA